MNRRAARTIASAAAIAAALVANVARAGDFTVTKNADSIVDNRALDATVLLRLMAPGSDGDWPAVVLRSRLAPGPNRVDIRLSPTRRSAA